MRRIGVINGLRGVAILGVIYHHVLTPLTPSGWHAFSVWGVPVLPFTVLSNGWQGVQLFFVLSGFVLALPYMAGDLPMASNADAFAFYRRRAARLLPLYLLNVVFCLTFLRVARTPAEFWTQVGEFLLNLTGLNPWSATTPLNWVLWSLHVEMGFCVLFPFLLRALRRYGAVIVLGAALLCSIAMRMIVYSTRNYAFENGVPVWCASFVAGMVLAGIHVRRTPVRTPRLWLAAGVACLAASFVLNDLLLMGHLSLSWRTLFLQLSLAGFFFLLLHALAPGGRILRPFLRFYPLQAIGLACYSFYVWHGIATWTLAPTRDAFHFTRYIVLVSVLSFLSYRYIEYGRERDFRRLLPQPEPADPRQYPR